MKKLITMGFIGIAVLSMVACATLETPTDNTTNDNETVSTRDDHSQTSLEEEFYVSPTEDYAVGEVITIGDIVDFSGDTVHIMSGDLIEVFKFDGDTAKSFYLGQTVQLIKGKEVDTLEHFEKEDYTVSHTNMGHPIDQITGKITTIEDEEITLTNTEGSYTITTYNPVQGLIGDQVTVYTMSFGTSISAIMVLNEGSKLILEVTEISRDDDGTMSVLAVDIDGGEYRLSLSHTLLEFDMTKLVIGDQLTVYHQGIMESWPMQVDTILIRK